MGSVCRALSSVTNCVYFCTLCVCVRVCARACGRLHCGAVGLRCGRYKSKAECDEMGKIIGKIDLSDPMTEIVVPTQKKIKKDVFQFNIITPGKSGKTYELFAENAESWAEWIRCTAHNIINSQKQTAGSPQRRSLLQMAALGQCELKTHVGWLYRKSKRKFVRIEGMTMSYFTDKPPKGKIEGNYSLFAVTIERLEGPSFRIVMPESTVGPKVFDWDADSVQAREEWISIIEGNQGTLEKTFAAKSQLGAGAGGDGGGGGVGGGSGKTGFYMSLPDILKPFEAEMGEGVIPEGFKEEVTRLSKEVLAEAKKNTTILKATLESPVLESVVQQDTGSLSQTRKVGGWVGGWVNRQRKAPAPCACLVFVHKQTKPACACAVVALLVDLA